MGKAEDLTEAVKEALVHSDLEVVDVERSPSTVRVLLDRPGGIDLEALSEANLLLSNLLDRSSDLAPSGRYELEVSSPGVERPLRTPEHFKRYVGSTVSLKTVPGTPGDRRVQGRIVSADDQGVVLDVGGEETLRFTYGDVHQARTVFEWGPGEGRRGSHAGAGRRKASR